MMTRVYALREAIVEFYRAQGSHSDLDEFQDEQFINELSLHFHVTYHNKKKGQLGNYADLKVT